MNRTRRSVLKASGVTLGFGSLAGCLDTSVLGGENGTASGYAAFFTLGDWASQVSGGELEFETPVEVGSAGHDWEPSGNVVPDIAETDVFVYLDTPEFSWAQTAADTIDRDYEHVVLVDGLEGIELLEWDHDHDEDEEEEDHDHDEDDHDHADGEYDPHVWVDPVRAKQVVDNIADGLAEAAPEDDADFRENAAAYTDRLETLDEQFRDLVDDAERTIAVLASHDSFTYLEDRYGFEFHTPVGVSPHDQPSFEEIAETVDVVDENGIDTVLYDPFESEELAKTIVENSDATETTPLTPAEGTTAEWTDRGWGYVEQMQEINLSALELALGSQ